MGVSEPQLRVRVCPRCSAELIALTDRRRELLELVLEGLEDKEFAERLHIAPSTAHGEIQQLYTEIGIHNRVRLAVWWSDFKRKNPDLFRKEKR